LRVEALLLLEQAGLSERALRRRVSGSPGDEEVGVNVEQPQAEPQVEPEAEHVEPQVEPEAELDFLEELELARSPLEELERELNVAREVAAAQRAEQDLLEEALAQRALERASLKPESQNASQVNSAHVNTELLFEDDLEGPIEEQLTLAPVALEAVALDQGELDEALDEPTHEVAPESLSEALSSAPAELSVLPAAPSVWPEQAEALSALLPPITRSPDAQVPFVGAGPERLSVVGEKPWLLPKELEWAELDLSLIKEQVGDHTSLSLAPRSFTPLSQTRRPVELRLQGDTSNVSTSSGAPQLKEGGTLDSLDLDDAFAEYDQPVSEEELLLDPELADMTRAYSALEMSLEASLAPTMASDEFSADERGALFEGLDEGDFEAMGVERPADLSQLSTPRQTPALASTHPTPTFNQQSALDELLSDSPLDEGNEMDFDFGEDSPMVWTEGSPTPLFNEEGTPSPVYEPRAARRARAQTESIAPAEGEANAPQTEPQPAQRSGLFGRLFGGQKD
jgi:hypothetical protein